MTARDLIRAALLELGVLGAADTLEAHDADLGLDKLNRLLDNWNAERKAVYADQILSLALTPSLNPHTIGPTAATWTVTQRPVSIEAANLVVGSARIPLNVHNEAGWRMTLSEPTTQGDPLDLGYEATWPNGSVYLWPVPDTADTIELLTRIVLARLTLNDDFSMPPGYEDATTLTLAETLAAAFKVEVSGLTVRNATAARARIFDNNDRPRPLQTDDGLMGGSGWYDYRTGRNR